MHWFCSVVFFYRSKWRTTNDSNEAIAEQIRTYLAPNGSVICTETNESVSFAVIISSAIRMLLPKRSTYQHTFIATELNYVIEESFIQHEISLTVILLFIQHEISLTIILFFFNTNLSVFMLVYSLFPWWGAACRGMMQMHCNDHLIQTVSQPWLELLHYQRWCWLSPLQQYDNGFRGWFRRKLMMTWVWSSLYPLGYHPSGRGTLQLWKC